MQTFQRWSSESVDRITFSAWSHTIQARVFSTV